MSKIVDLGSSQTQRPREFCLEDLSDDTLLDTRSGAVVTLNTTAISAKDWTNQELSSIFRAIRLLQGTGIVVEIDRGVADDGSPWYAFCSAQGDVLVHIARIDNTYVLDGVGLAAPLRGRTFDELINRFVGSRTGETASGQQVGLAEVFDLSKRRRDNLFVHPAAQFAALLWAAMIVKDAAAASEIEATFETLQDGPDILAPAAPHPEKSLLTAATMERIADRADTGASDLFVKSRDGGQGTLTQAVGLMSLAYFLVGFEQTSPAVVLERYRLETDDNSAPNTTVITEAPALTIFAQALSVIESLVPFLDDSLPAHPKDNDLKIEFTLADLDHPDGFAILQLSAQTVPDIDLSLDNQAAVQIFQVPEPSVKPETKMSVAMDLHVDEVLESPTLANLLEYVQAASYVSERSLEARNTDIAEIIEIREQGASETPTPAQRIDDQDVISAIYEFLISAEEELIYYRSDGVHVIEQGDVSGEDSTDLLTFLWTFEDGSQIMIVGASEALANLDLFV